ncbi:MAG: transposase [Bacteroidales bacterium]|nr:transposase [Bacteroidales bacterium]
MSEKYKITDNDRPYFLTMTTIGWVDIFTRKEQKLLVIDSLSYCQKEKGLIIFAYCLMPSHLHMICKADEGFSLSDILRDMKKFTSKAIVEQMMEEAESRREWLLPMLSKEGKKYTREQKYKVWQNGNQPEIIYSPSFLYEKLEYVHNNPVQDLIVEKPEDYLFSSARNYAGLDNFLDVVVLDHKPLIKNWRM